MKGTPIFDDENYLKQMVLVARDISTQKERKKLEYYVYHDPLTGLPNRRYFEKCVTESIEALNFKGSAFSLILIDIDDFKIINDSWGHEIGDTVIQEVANRTQRVIGEKGLAARLGGDEFIVLLYNSSTEQEIIEVIKNLQNEFLKEIIAEGNSIAIKNSIGATICTKKYMSETYFFKSADVALYEVKQNGKNHFHINFS